MLQRSLRTVCLLGVVAVLTIPGVAQDGMSPAAPARVEASDDLHTDRIQVQWEPVSGATSYEVWRSTFQEHMYIPIAYTGLTEIVDRTIQASQYYYYKVRACGDDGCGAFSAFDVGSWMISVPDHVWATRGRFADRIVVTWDWVDGATLYYVYRSDHIDSGYHMLAMVDEREFRDTGALAGKVYYYRIRALTTSTGSDLSPPVIGYRDESLRHRAAAWRFSD